MYNLLRMKKTSLIVFLLIFTNLSFGQEIENSLNGIDQEIETLLKSYNAVGLAVSVVKNNKIIYSKGFGYRDLENKLPVNENTVFPIASCSKAFTASLLGLLDYENTISLKAKPSLYLPKIIFYNSEMDHLISIEDLLSHKSGLGNLDGTLVLFPEKSSVKVMQKLKHIKPEGNVKGSWIYSNMGYTIAGVIIENVTKMTWQENLSKKIFIPLQMSNTFTDLERMKQTNNYSFGYGLYNGKIKKVLYENYYNYKPAGGIRSTSKDLSNWMITWLNKGNFNGKTILPEKYIQKATTIHNTRPDENEDEVFLFGDGLGWRMESHTGKYKVYHGGNTSGFSNLIVTYPFEKLGITVLTNQNKSILPYIIADIIKNRLLGLQKTDLKDYPIKVTDIYLPSKINQQLNPKKKPSHNLSSFAGTYKNKGYGTVEITFKNGNLLIRYPTYEFFLEHLYYNVFVMKPTKEISQVMNPEFAINFKTSNSGKISAFTINLQSMPVEFTKQIVD